MRILFLFLIPASLAFGQEAGPRPVAAQRGTVRRTLERPGTFVPAGAAELKLDLERYRGELVVAEVAPHGSFVNKDDVVARFETKGIDEQIRSEKMALERSAMGLRHAVETARMAAEKAAEALDRAEVDYARAVKRLEGYREHEKGFNDEAERLSVQAREYRLDDQKDELDQLEKMYSEDELVDATEEIVLKRSRRNFARSEASAKLAERRRLYNREWYLPWREEDLERDVRVKAGALSRLKAKQEIDRERREADLSKTRFDLERQRANFADLEKDRAKFVLRAPRGGILLHGAAKAAPWAARLKKGARLKSGAVVASVAGAREYEVRTDIPEKDVLALPASAAAEIRPTAAPARKLVGRLEVDFLPAKGGVFPARIPVTAENDVRLRPGLTGKVVVILEEERDVVVVPPACVQERDGKWYASVAKTADGPFEEREVAVGLRDAAHVAIRDGIAEGEFVKAP